VLGTLNIGLGVFNLLPVPPLDGSKILFMFLPDRWVLTVYRYEGYIRLALILGLYFGLLNNVIVTGQSFVYRTFINAALSICGAVGLV
jgi:Zn-dependent protease